jgi:predicted permease
MQAGWNQVLPGFFSTMGVALIAGREFNDRDVTGGSKVAIVDETFVKRFYPHENPIGRHVGFGGPPDMEIVGVVKPMKGGDLRETPKPYTYTPVLQQERPSAITFYVRSGADPRALAQGARQAVARLDSSLPLYDLKTLRTQINETHFMDRIFATLSAAFGVLATLLASVGLYGVTAYTVARRRQEIGIRVALGARRADVLRLVFREVILLTVAGVSLGIPLALGAGRMIESALFGVRGADPAVLAAAVIVIAAVSAISGYLPARRAARIDPLRALRYE